MHTEPRPVTDTYHGVEIVDPYRWLEGSDAPEIDGVDEDLNRRVSDWTDAQNAETRRILDARPGRAALEVRLRALLEVGEVGLAVAAGDRYFYDRREGNEAQASVNLVEGWGSEPRVIIDPAELDPDGLTTVSWISPSRDGRFLAFGVFAKGDEKDVLHVLDVDRGEWLSEEIPGRAREARWLPDSSGFFYYRLADVDDPYSAQIRFHRLGRHHRHDPILIEQEKEGPLATTWGPFVHPSRDGRWLIVGYYTGTDSNDLWVADLDLWLRTGELVRREIVTGERGMSMGQTVGDVLYLRTTVDAPRGRVVAVDLHRPEKERWREIVPEREDAVLQATAMGRGVLALTYLVDATSRIETVTPDGESLGALTLPGLGSAVLAAHQDRTEAFLRFESFNEPVSIYRVDLATRERELWLRPDVPVDPGLAEVRQIFYESKDGTKVPMFLVHKKGLEPDGARPVVLSGYGGFGVSRTPMFNGSVFPWIEAGGVYAVANLRGGGEYGEEWHRAGMGEKKQNVFDDCIAAGEWLVANGYTTTDRLGVVGGSNGGLLTGAVLTQRPDLFGAVVSSMPLLDMLRYQHFLMAKYWVPEYGSSEDSAEFEVLRAYSPYHRIEDGTAYPAVLLVAGEHDTRVHALHARKMAARLAAATTSDPEKKPILLWEDREGGHGPGKPMANRLREAADLWSFLAWRLAIDPVGA